jgi:hypothetical protein
MYKFQHSPSPWHLSQMQLRDAADRPIATFVSDVRWADAVMISQVPEFKDALIECVEALEQLGGGPSETLERARTVLNKFAARI